MTLALPPRPWRQRQARHGAPFNVFPIDAVLIWTSAFWHPRVCIQGHSPRDTEPFRLRPGELHHFCPHGQGLEGVC